MLNPETHERTFTDGGTTYTLRLDTAALVKLEALVSTPSRELTWLEVLSRVARGSMTYTRAMLWAALQRHHPTLTLAEVEQLLDRVGLDRLQEQLTEVIDSTRPDPRDVADLPSTAQVESTNGTGERLN